MKIEIWLGRPGFEESCTLEFDDTSITTKQYNVAIIKYDTEGKEIERKAIGVVNKVDIVRIAKAS